MILIAGVFDAMSALIAQKVGFKAVYLSGGGLSSSYLGKPDIGLLTLDEVVGHVKRICDVIDIPLYVDADTGFGGDVNLMRAVRQIEAAGAAGIQIEDQAFPKRCGHLKGKSLVSQQTMVNKIKVAIKARRKRGFKLIARTDARGVTGFNDALKRAQAYKKNGADVIFPEALTSPREFEIFGQKKGLGPILANMTEFGVSPLLEANRLALMGIEMVLYPMTAFRASAKAMEKALKTVKKLGSNRGLLNQIQTRQELYELNKYDIYNKTEKKLK